MDIDSPRGTGSMLMDIDGGAVSSRQPSGHSFDSAKMDSSDSDCALSDFHSRGHQLAGSTQPAVQSLPGEDDSPHFMVPAPSSPSVIQLGETGPEDIRQRRRLAEHGVILSSLRPSIENTTLRKRKRTHTDITDNNHVSHDDTFIDVTDSRRRRVRPRLQERQNAEFSPLLIMPHRRDSSAGEETISAFYFPPPVTDASYPIRPHFHLENPLEHGPRTMQSGPFADVGSMGDPKESGRSDSTSSFNEVALASTVAPKHGRLSTLPDFWLPRPFEETERSFMDGVKVHERGLEVPPESFFSANAGRMGGLGASRVEQAGSATDTLEHSIHLLIREHEPHAVSPQSTILPLEPESTAIYFDKPLCDSPDSIGSDEAKFGPGPSRMQVDHGARFYSTP